MKEVLVITDDKKSSINQCLALINSLKKKKKLRFEHKIVNRKLIHEFPNIIIYYLLVVKSFFKKKRNKENRLYYFLRKNKCSLQPDFKKRVEM